MKRIGFFLFGLVFLSTLGLWADTAETIPLLTILSPANEAPPVTANASGSALILVHVVRDDSGAIKSGSVDFNVSVRFPGAVTVSGLHIHKAPVGVSGPILIPTDVRSEAVDSTGRSTLLKQVQFPADSGEPSLNTLRDLLNNPSDFYVNLHTTDNPGGVMRGQLLGAQMTVLMGLQSPANETPPLTGLTSSGISTVTVFRAINSSGNLAAATVIFHLEYTGFVPGTTFTGFHIHKGLAGVAGPVTINTGIGSGAASVAASDSGTGVLGDYTVVVSPADASFAAEADTINGLFDNPNGFYINTHTSVNPGGEVRSQLHATDKATLQVALSPANETPPVTGLTASGTTAVTVYTVRNADGNIVAGTIIFDVNYRGFPANVSITGLHIHQEQAGKAGPIRFPTDVGKPAVTSATGSGNIYKSVTVATADALTALNALVQDPSGFYENLHTTDNPGGAIRSQLVTTPAGKPVVGSVTSAATTTLRTVAPGEIVSVYGSSLATFVSDLSGFFQPTALPTGLNGVSVTVAGIKAPLYYVSPLQVNAQIPLEVASGQQPVVVTTAGGSSTALNFAVANAAPAIFVDQGSGLAAIIKNNDGSLITSGNPATAGDILLIYSTGLGQTTPTLRTGSLQSPTGGSFNNTVDVAVTIGGQTARVIYSIASPGFAGLYQTAVVVPSGVTGTSAVLLRVGTVASNSVNIAVR